MVRWRRVDLRDKLAERFSVSVHKRTVAKWLRELDLTRLQPRPFHPNQDAAAQVAYRKMPAPGSRGVAGIRAIAYDL